MINRKSELGNLGEDKACEYLVDNGYRVIARNYRKPWGEIDIIAKANDRTLVFVEVKTIEAGGDAENLKIRPEDNLTSAKLRKLIRTCELCVNANPEFLDEEKGWRLDLVALTKIEKDFVINHYENIAG